MDVRFEIVLTNPFCFKNENNFLHVDVRNCAHLTIGTCHVSKVSLRTFFIWSRWLADIDTDVPNNVISVSFDGVLRK